MRNACFDRYRNAGFCDNGNGAHLGCARQHIMDNRIGFFATLWRMDRHEGRSKKIFFCVAERVEDLVVGVG
ncbi:MAG: hypothetical protein WCG06_04155, partial [Candidatus Omnitrophota bacterium]